MVVVAARGTHHNVVVDVVTAGVLRPALGEAGQVLHPALLAVHRHLGPGFVSSTRHHHVVWHLYSTSFPGGSDDYIHTHTYRIPLL